MRRCGPDFVKRRRPPSAALIGRLRDLGLRPGFNLDNIAEVLAQAEGEDFR